MNNKRRNILLILGVLIAVGIMSWWYYPRYTPTAYVGVRVPDTSGPKSSYAFPSYIAKIDLEAGEIVDTFPLSDNVPVVRDIAVDWKRRKLYAVGDPIIETNRKRLTTSKGIDIYDLDSQKLVDRIEFETNNAKIRRIRFNPTYDKLFVDNPLNIDEKQKGKRQHITWIINPETKRVISTFDASFGYRHIFSPLGLYMYFFLPEIEQSKIGPGKSVYSINRDTSILSIDNRNDLIKGGGWQPDPEGKYEDEPFTLDYPQMWGKNPIKFYNRDTLELIAKVELEQEGEDVSGGGGGYQETVTKNNKYMVSTIGLRPAGFRQPYTGALKVIDLEKYEVVHTIEVGPLITEVDVY